MTDLNPQKYAVKRAIEMLREAIRENVHPDQISMTGVVIEMYLVSMALPDAHGMAGAVVITDHFCDLVGVERDECYDMALNLLKKAKQEIAEQN